ncbi:hypothetical protein ACN082_09835 [Rothia sp. CCM 9417]|uniref:hypothetical protein n=1 Tax=Rothia sp. CCM 9417 TaxID=3402657 RepID=UPI003AD807FB
MKKLLALTALATTALTGCTATEAPAPAEPASPILTWHDADGDGVRDTLVTTSHGCATEAGFFDVYGGFTGYRVEAGTQCMTSPEIIETLVTFIELDGGI